MYVRDVIVKQQDEEYHGILGLAWDIPTYLQPHLNANEHLIARLQIQAPAHTG